MANPIQNSESQISASLPPVLCRYRGLIVEALREELAFDGISMYKMLRYSMGWSDIQGNPMAGTEGKILRPTLCLLTCEATGGLPENAIPAAAALEFVHNFSLIHDDIQDRDTTRHHRPTLWSVWGEPKALVAGDALMIMAHNCLRRLPKKYSDFDLALKVQGELTASSLEMIEGQVLDIEFEGHEEISLENYLKMISLKTGALMKSSMVLGSMIGSRDQSLLIPFARCGRYLGTVFQIRDDVLGVWGKERSTGKPVSTDIRRRKKSFPIVHAMSKSRGNAKKQLINIYKSTKMDDAAIFKVLEIMDQVGTLEYAQTLASEYLDRAICSLSELHLDSNFLKDFVELANFLLVREY